MSEPLVTVYERKFHVAIDPAMPGQDVTVWWYFDKDGNPQILKTEQPSNNRETKHIRRPDMSLAVSLVAAFNAAKEEIRWYRQKAKGDVENGRIIGAENILAAFRDVTRKAELALQSLQQSCNADFDASKTP